MGIYIKGMDMPKSCDDCPCLDRQYGICQANADKGYIYSNKPSWCPLVELPPHGRLIDADAFRTANGLGEDCENCHRNTRTCNYDVCLSRMDVCGWVDDAPTIIESEEEE